MRHSARPRVTALRVSMAATGAVALVAVALGGTAFATNDGAGGKGGDNGKAGSVTAAKKGGQASSPEHLRLKGKAKLLRPQGDIIHFAFDGRGAMPDTKGTFRFSHYLGDEGAFAEGKLDCMVSGGPVTMASGIVTKSDLKDLKGKRVGFTVTNDGKRLGYSWAGTNDPSATKDLPPCAASAPYERVESGGFDVTPWEPEL